MDKTVTISVIGLQIPQKTDSVGAVKTINHRPMTRKPKISFFPDLNKKKPVTNRKQEQ